MKKINFPMHINWPEVRGQRALQKSVANMAKFVEYMSNYLTKMTKSLVKIKGTIQRC